MSVHGHFGVEYARQRAALLSERFPAASQPWSDASATGPSARLDTTASARGSVLDGAGLRRSLDSPRTSGSSSPRGSLRPGSSVPTSPSLASATVTIVPTRDALASRAMAGGGTIDDNYAFAGMHHLFSEHQSAVTRVQFGNDERSLLCTGSRDGTLCIMQALPSGQVLRTLSGPRAAITSFAWSSANDLILSTATDGAARLWHVPSGRLVREIYPGGAAKAPASLHACAFHPANNNVIVLGDARGCVWLVNASTGRVLGHGAGPAARCGGAVHAMALDALGGLLWVGDAHGTVTAFRFDATLARLLRTARTSLAAIGFPGAVTSLSYRRWILRDQPAPVMLCNCQCNALLLLGVDVATGALKLRRAYRTVQERLDVHSCFSPLMSFRPGACVATGSEDASVLLYDITRDERPLVNRLQGHLAAVVDVSWSADESLLASGDADGVCILWKRVTLPTAVAATQA